MLELRGLYNYEWYLGFALFVFQRSMGILCACLLFEVVGSGYAYLDGEMSAEYVQYALLYRANVIAHALS